MCQFKSMQNFKVNANTDIQDAVQTSTVESNDDRPPRSRRCSEKHVTTIDQQFLTRETTDLNGLPHRREQNEQRGQRNRYKVRECKRVASGPTDGKVCEQVSLLELLCFSADLQRVTSTRPINPDVES